MATRREFLLHGLGLMAAGPLVGGCADKALEAKSPVVTIKANSARIGDVAYARSVTGIAISGEAWNWWDGANGRYPRGNVAAPGAVLVFQRQQSLPTGHLAVVTKVVGTREIRVSHADWTSTWATRGRITGNVPVLDISQDNDWTTLRLWYAARGTVDRIYRAYGFVYRGDRPSAPVPPKDLGVEI